MTDGRSDEKERKLGSIAKDVERREKELQVCIEEGLRHNAEKTASEQDFLYETFLKLQREGINKHLCQLRYQKMLIEKGLL